MVRGSASRHTRGCRQSTCSATAATTTRPSGTAFFATPKRPSAVSIAMKILAAPGVLSSIPIRRPSDLISSATTPAKRCPRGLPLKVSSPARVVASKLVAARLRVPWKGSAASYLVSRGQGLTIIAGYPWFCDWGRDTFIALRGLCFATGRFGEARDILVEWSQVVSEGMLPNLFPDNSGKPEYNSVSARHFGT